MTDKRTPREQLRFVLSLLEAEDRADRAEVRRIEALSDEALDAELAAKGVDPAKARALGRETLEKFEREQGAASAVAVMPAGRVVPLRKGQDKSGKGEKGEKGEKRVAWPVLLVAAAIFVVIGGMIAVAVLLKGGVEPIVPDTYDALPPPKPDLDAELIAKAEGLRKQAFAHCSAQEWLDCLVAFHDADTLDPGAANERTELEAKAKANAALDALEDAGADSGRKPGGWGDH
jgi:hypothetical protein